MHAALIGFLDPMPSAAQVMEMSEPPHGAWRVRDIIDGPASGRDDKVVQITSKRLVLAGGEQKQEFVIVGINPDQEISTIDLWDRRHGRTYRGIYERKGKRLRICIQLWITGNAKASVRPESFKEADSRKVFGPTLYVLELD
jgi:uncharacterized protein (TIGR03067 family)